MLETLAVLPFPFWVCAVLIVTGCVWASHHFREGTGIPVIAVLGTIGAWYIGDALYNDYASNHTMFFPTGLLSSAWWQVALFLFVFLSVVPTVNRLVNAPLLHHTTATSRLFSGRFWKEGLQIPLRDLLYCCAVIWLVLAALAILRLREQSVFFFFPFLGQKVDAWGRDRIGAGIDALLSLASYFQMLVAASFGIVAALAKPLGLRWTAIVGCGLTWPYYILDRTRSSMIVVLLPAILSWVFIRLKGKALTKVVLLFVGLLLVDSWFRFVIAVRDKEAVAVAVRGKRFSLSESAEAHHFGLNMFEELCHINSFIADGSYPPNWGQRYFAELVNPIPRALWPGKPTIGIDYAIARGQASSSEEGAGVYATISTGLIGQGVVNFGRLLGPSFAGVLMSFWVAILARLDLQSRRVGRLPLYVLGLVLTFNLGRDITLITLYPFVFGLVILVWLDWRAARLNVVGIAAHGSARSKGRNSTTSTELADEKDAPRHLTLPSAKGRRPGARYSRLKRDRTSHALRQ